MSKPYILLLNGPPGSGKDTIGRILQADYGFAVKKCAAPIRAAMCMLFGIGDSDIEALKPLPTLGGKTLREWMIGYSELYLKPLGGKRVFGELLVERILKSGATRIAVTDSGFKDETDVVVEAFGADRVTMVHIHRPGCSFEGDSRSYVKDERLRTFVLRNDGSLHYLRTVVEGLLPSPFCSVLEVVNDPFSGSAS